MGLRKDFIYQQLADSTPSTVIGFTTGGTATLYYLTGITSNGAITGATNGLTKTGSKLKLGGTLTGATSITFTGFTANVVIENTAQKEKFSISADYGTLIESGDYTNYTGATGSFSVNGDNIVSYSQDDSGNSVQLDVIPQPNAFKIYDGRATATGIQYDADYSANFTPRSLVDKGYVTGLTGSLGNVTKVGTPVDNQIGIWTGNGTIEGVTNLTYTGGLFKITQANSSNAEGLNIEQGTTLARWYQESTSSTIFVNKQLTISNAGSNDNISISAGQTLYLGTNQDTNTGGIRMLGSIGGGTLYEDNTFFKLRLNSTNATATQFNISGSSTFSSASVVNFKNLSIRPTYNHTGSVSAGSVVYGIYYNPTLTSLTNTTNYAFVSSSGRHGLGTLLPTATVHITGGTTTLAPLKLTTGTALTTPEDGSIEYHSSHLYFTIGSTRYQLDQQSGGGVPSGAFSAYTSTNLTLNPTKSINNNYTWTIPAANPTLTWDFTGVTDGASGILEIIKDNSSTERKIAIPNNTLMTTNEVYLATKVGETGKTVTGAVANGSLIRLTVSGHSLSTNDWVYVASVGGINVATGFWQVTNINTNTIDLQGSVFAGTYTSGGSVTLCDYYLDIYQSANSVNIYSFYNRNGTMRMTGRKTLVQY